MSEGPYTTITVAEFSRMTAIISHLRKRMQKVRELLENGDTKGALDIAKFEEDHP